MFWFRYCFRYLDTEQSLDICPSFKCGFPKGQWHCPFAYTSSIVYSVSCCLVSFSILVHTCVTNFMSSHVYTVCKQTTLHVNSQGRKITIRCTLHCCFAVVACYGHLLASRGNDMFSLRMPNCFHFPFHCKKHWPDEQNVHWEVSPVHPEVVQGCPGCSGCTAALQKEGPWFEPMYVLRISCVCVLQLPPTAGLG